MPGPSRLQLIHSQHAMRERGIDISRQRSEHLAKYLETEFDYVITVCDTAADKCPQYPWPARRIHWSYPNPAAIDGDETAILESIRSIRDGLEAELRAWLTSLN